MTEPALNSKHILLLAYLRQLLLLIRYENLPTSFGDFGTIPINHHIYTILLKKKVTPFSLSFICTIWLQNCPSSNLLWMSRWCSGEKNVTWAGEGRVCGCLCRYLAARLAPFNTNTLQRRHISMIMYRECRWKSGQVFLPAHPLILTQYTLDWAHNLVISIQT